MTVTTFGSNTGDTGGTEDTWLDEANPTTNRDGSGVLDISKYGAGNHTMTLIRWTGLAAAIGSDTVSDAYASIYHSGGSGDTGNSCDFYQLLRAWVETEATWNIYSTGNSWGTAGGLNTTDRVGGSSSGNIAFGATGAYRDSTADTQLATDVQDIVDSAEESSWHFERTDGSNDSTYSEFTKSEGTDGQRPTLTVTHAAAVAGSSNLTLLGVG